MISSPACGNGVNTAERVPTMTRASPREAAAQTRALVVVQPRMQCVHGDAKAAAEACQGLRGQADFRHQHQRLPALRQAVDDGLQVHLGLAAAGHAIQQEGLEAFGGVDRGHRLGLVRVEGGAGQRLRMLRCHRHRHALGQRTLGQAARGGAPVLHAFAQYILIHHGPGQQFGQLPRAAAGAQLPALGMAFGVNCQPQWWVSGRASP